MLNSSGSFFNRHMKTDSDSEVLLNIFADEIHRAHQRFVLVSGCIGFGGLNRFGPCIGVPACHLLAAIQGLLGVTLTWNGSCHIVLGLLCLQSVDPGPLAAPHPTVARMP
eukprot:GHUV01032168.1.p1 GENE.GHUV01032168.1~~GHUV01032168.1.p1  ORF type:complete len:110 (-),score=19.04 GHUV01032168.1:139-468(-)